MKTLELAKAYWPEAVEMRRWLHQNAELSMEEYETTAYILRELNRIGIPFLRPHSTGAIAIIQGRQPGKTVGLRADNDALPIREDTGLGFAARNEGVMHACGHDFHTAALLTAARILWGMREEFEGTVKLIFQPGEEGAESGALAMLSGGNLDDCSAFFALHVNNSIPAGKACLQAGPCMAASSGLYITLRGKGGHGGRPWEAVDPIVAAAAVIMNLQPLLTRELDSHHMVVASIGTIHGGAMKNIIPESVTMEGTLRFYEPALEKQLRQSITRIVEHTCKAYRAEAEVRVTESFPAVINDSALASIAEGAGALIWGSENLVSLPSNTGNDDFAFYGAKAPLFYGFVGTGNKEKHGDYPAHHPKFDVDERALEGAAAFYAQIALEYLNKY